MLQKPLEDLKAIMKSGKTISWVNMHVSLAYVIGDMEFTIASVLGSKRELGEQNVFVNIVRR